MVNKTKTTFDDAWSPGSATPAYLRAGEVLTSSGDSTTLVKVLRATVTSGDEGLAEVIVLFTANPPHVNT